MQRISTGVLILVCVATFACSDPEKDRQEYVRQAEISLKKKDYATAIVNLRNAVRLDSKSGSTRLLLAQAYEAAGQLPQARAESVRAADLLPSDINAQLLAARSLIRTGGFEEARTRAQAALKLDPKNVEGHLLRGRAAAGMDDLVDAATAFEEGLLIAPGEAELQVNRGRLNAVQGKDAEAEASFKQAIVVAPQSLDARLALADFYWFSRKLPAAEQALKDALALKDESGRAARTLAMFYVMNNRPAEAEAPLRTAVAATGDPRLKLTLADYYVQTQKADLAVPLLQELSTQAGGLGPATLRLATIEFRKPGHGKAYALLDDLLKKEPSNAEALTRKAQYFFAEGKRPEALASAQAAIKVNPDAALAHEVLGMLFIQGHELQQAEAALKESLRLDTRAVRSLILMSSLSLERGLADEAVELAERAVQRQPLNAEARLMLVRALTATGNTDRARAEVARLTPDHAEVQATIGDLESRRGNRSAARAAYQRAASLNPKSLEALQGLVKLDAIEKKLDGAVQRVDRVAAGNANNPQMLLLAARTHAEANDLAAAEAKALEALKANPDLRPAYDLLGTIYRRQNRLQEAQRIFERVSAERPTDVPAHTMVGILQLVRGDQSNARQRFEKVLSIDPRAAVASNNLAYLDAEAGTNLDMALNRAQTAKAALPDDPEVDDTLGWIYVKKGLPALAQSPLNEAVKKDGNNPLYLYHLGMAYAGMGDKERARTTLQSAMKISPNFPGSVEARRTLDGLAR